jgi:putative DNA primase/helicase
LQTGELRPADPADYISKITAVAPAAESECPRWRRFLEEATCGDAGMIRFLQQWAGYSLTGDIREHTLVFIHGDGGNGKGVWLNTIANILKDYAATATMTTFTAGIFDHHPTEVAMLAGARMVTATETEENHAWAEARIKAMTGGDPITAHFMRRDNFTYVPAFKLTIVGNHKPALKNIDPAMKRRLRIVPFIHKPKVVNPQLKEELRKEWPGILRWMIEGQQNGLTTAAAIAAATDEYFEERDLVGEWLEKYDVDPGNKYKTSLPSDLYQSWRDFADKAGFSPGSQRTLADRLKSKGLRNGKSGSVRYWYGIRLKVVEDGDGNFRQRS